MEGAVVATVVMEANAACVNNGCVGWLWKWWLRCGGDGGVHDEGNGVENVMMAVMLGGCSVKDGGGSSNDGETDEYCGGGDDDSDSSYNYTFY